MNFKQLSTATLLFSGLILSACNPMHLLQPKTNSSGEKIVTGAEFDITPNPQAKQAYKLKLKLKDVPAPGFKKWNAWVYFDVENVKECGYYLGGSYQDTVPAIERAIDFKLNQISTDEFEGVFYTDWGLDGDFFGRGVCHWRFRNVGASFRAQGNDGETRFGLAFDSLADEDHVFAVNKPLTRYYRKEVYPVNPLITNAGDTGVDLEVSKRYDDPNDLFSITATIEELK